MDTEYSFHLIEIFEVDDDNDMVFTGDLPKAEFQAALSRQSHISRATCNPNAYYADSNSDSEILLISPTTSLDSEPKEQHLNYCCLISLSRRSSKTWYLVDLVVVIVNSDSSKSSSIDNCFDGVNSLGQC